MKRKFTLLVAPLLYTISLFASVPTFTFSPSKQVNANFSCNILEESDVSIISATQGLNLAWTIIENTLPQDTSCIYTQLCDNQLCYTTLPPSGDLDPLNMGLNNNVFKLGVDPKNYVAGGVLKIRVYEEGNTSNADTLTYIVSGCPTGGVCLTSIKEENLNLERLISVYPSPARDVLTIKFSEIDLINNKPVVFYNILGEKVMSMRLNKAELNKINISTLSAGIYFVRYESESGKMVTKKFYKGN